MKSDPKYEYDKEVAFLKFVKENPFHPFSEQQKNRIKRFEIKEKNRKKFVKECEKIMRLRYKNNLSFAKIGKKYGVSRQAIEQKISRFTQITKKMKEKLIQVIEECHNNVRLAGKDFRFRIFIKPIKDSLEVNMYEKRWGVTDVEALSLASKDAIDRMRIDAAMEVFREFYVKEFISK